MAIVTKGPYLGFSGTVDGLTYYQLPNGKTVVKRKNGKRTKPAAPGQLPIMNDTAICAQFMKPLKEFVKIGYDIEAGILQDNPNNAMVKHIRKNAIVGEYPERKIDFSKVLVTKGLMPAPEVIATEVTEEGIAIHWDTSLIPKKTFYSDQVIILAYFAALGESRYISGGAQRHLGSDLLILEGIEKDAEMEIYIAFVSDDRKNISNSVYLGQFSW